MPVMSTSVKTVANNLLLLLIREKACPAQRQTGRVQNSLLFLMREKQTGEMPHMRQP